MQLKREADRNVESNMNSASRTSAIVGGRKDQHYRFTILADGLLRYEWAPDFQFEDRPSAFAAQRDQARKTTPSYRTKETDDTLEIITSRFHLTYNKQEFSPHGLFVLVHLHTRSLWRYGEPCETLGGTARTLDGVDGRIGVGPGVISPQGYVAVDDSDTMLFDKDGFVAPRCPGRGRVDGYLFAYGHDYREAVKALYSISGSTPMLPRWALGNWWSRYYEYTADSYLALMDKFREQGIPLSVAVLDMDWHLVDDPRVIEAGQTGWTGYTWNKDLFPDPPTFMAELHKRKLKTTLNDHPADGVHSYEDLYYKVAKALDHDVSNKEPIPFNITDRRFLYAYFEILLRSLEDDGCDFWWVDWQQGPYSRLKGVDPLWVLNHFHFLHNAKTHPHNPIIFSRFAGPGSHRYPIGFSGDTVVSWASLDFQPEFTATASNIGYGWWSHDIGGHLGGVRDDELTTRWVQLGVFSPVMRLHSTKSRWVAKEPWKLPAPYSGVVSDFLRLRHRMIPYLHTMNARAAMQGEPLVQPMYWEYPYRHEAYRVKNQYLFGSEMMVMPITTPQDPRLRLGKVKGWLPPGTWVDFFSGVVYDGNREIWISRPLDSCPVFTKQGSIVPLDEASEPANGGAIPTGFEVVMAVGADGYFEIMEDTDDYETSGSSSQETHWSRTPIRFTQATGIVQIGPTQGSSPVVQGQTRRWSIRLLGMKKSGSVPVTVDGVTNQVSMFKENNGLSVRLGELSPQSTATVELGSDPQLDRNVPATLVDPIIRAAQIEYQTKEAIWDVVADANVTMSAQISRLQALGMSSNLRIAVSECLLANSRS